MYALRLSEDHLGAGQGLRLAPANRVLWVAEGDVVVVDLGTAKIASDHAWHGTRECQVTSPNGARVLRWDLVTPSCPGHVVEAVGGVRTSQRLEHPIALEAGAPYLMRCDRVDFEPGGEARPHGHRGGGIRCLVAGRLEVRIAGRPGRVMQPGDTWFESGVEPVHAIASPGEPTSFLRVSILPRAIRGQSSIVYVNPADAGVKPRRYTVYVDEPIEIA
ncbi:MAG: hypothetical protein ACREKB_19420 [Candidatus Rokuibacteriota bacterium]